MPVAASRRTSGTGGRPSIRAGIVSPTGVQKGIVAGSAPNNHFIADPDSTVELTSIKRVSSAGCRPTIRAGIISPAGV